MITLFVQEDPMTTNHHPAFVALSRWIIEEAAPFVWGVIDHPKFDKTPRILRVALNPAPTTPDGVIRSLSVFYARTLETTSIPIYAHHSQHEKLAILAYTPVFQNTLSRLMLPFLHAIPRPSPLVLTFSVFHHSVFIRRAVEHDNPLPFTTPEHIKRAALLLNVAAFP